MVRARVARRSSISSTTSTATSSSRCSSRSSATSTLTDSQLGWLGSAYILVFSVAALPFGVLSDLRSRRAVIAGGVTVWSAFTFLERPGQDVRAALHLPGAGRRRRGGLRAGGDRRWWRITSRPAAARWRMGILSSGIALGGVLGLLLGGHLEGVYGWRVAFMTVGRAGVHPRRCSSRASRTPCGPGPLTVRSFLRDFEIGAMHAGPAALAAARGRSASAASPRSGRTGPTAPTRRWTWRRSARAVGLGLAVTILRWVRRTPGDQAEAGGYRRRSRARSPTSCARAARCCTRPPWCTSSRPAP